MAVSYELRHVKTTDKLYSWGNIAFPHALYNPDTGKFYLATAKKSDGKVYLVEIDKNGNVRELQLQMPVYPDSTYGDGDCHIIPAIAWLDNNKTKIVAVGGDHVGGSFHIEIINVETWQSEKVIDSGIYGSYHILIRKSTGEIIIFYRNNSNGHLYYVKYNPSDNSISSAVQVTTASSGESAKGIGFGYDYDTGRYILHVTPDWSNFYVFEFDVEQEKFYDINGNELTLPFNPSSLLSVIANNDDAIIKYNNYIYSIHTKDVDSDNNPELVLFKHDLQGNITSKILADNIDVNNYWWGDYRGIVYVANNKLRTIYSTPTVVKAIEFDENMNNITELASLTPSVAPLRAHNIFIDDNLFAEAIATGEDYHDQNNEILQASNPQYLNVYYVEELKPEFRITNYPTTISGKPGGSKSFQVTVSNDGGVDGVAELRIKDHNGNIVFSEQKTIPAGTCYLWNVTITLPSTPGSYQWTIEVYNVDQGAVDDSKTFTVEVTGEGEGVVPVADWMSLLMQMMLFMLIIMIIMLPVLIITS